MSSYVEKLLPILIYPLGLTLLLCITAFALSFAGQARALRVSIAVAAILLWLASTPAFAGLLTVILEEQNPPVPIETISPEQAELLWRAGKVQTIIVTGGNLPWPRASTTDAGFAAELLQAYGVPPDSIIVESNSRNTHENAINTAAIWRERHFRSGLLVTSATHMPRAIASFRKSGLDVAPWPAVTCAVGIRPLASLIFCLTPTPWR
jgi:uncharacterized SAM-binding protein YcdF (DUF218 family)